MLSVALRARLDALLQCGFRPFFLFTAAWGALALAAWLAALGGALALPTVAGGALAWHAHEMVLGFGGAALIGFLLTALPEFTASPAVTPRQVAMLALLWLSARAGFLWGEAPGQWLAAVAECALLGGTLAIAAPRLWRDPARRHLSFLWGLVALLASTVGYHAAALGGGQPLAWLNAAVGVMMVFIVLALSRISMRVVNGALQERGETTAEYLARPPRRNLAIFCIALFTAVELLLPLAPVTGWIALAAAAALFNLANDWHVGRVLFSRWVFMLYLVYWLIAAGYLLLGLALLGVPLSPSAGRHLLMAGGMGLSIFVVMNIAGRIHAGVPLERGLRVPLGAGLIVCAALLRAGYSIAPFLLLGAAGALWIAVFAWQFAAAWPVLSRPRGDGQSGCAGLREDLASPVK
jgi:uncharacterized protein involved in response to NO